MSSGLIMLLFFVIRALLARREAQQKSALRIFPSPDERTSARTGWSGPVCEACGAPYNRADYRPDVQNIYCSHCHAELSKDALVPQLDNGDEPMTEHEAQAFNTTYYLSPSPERVAAALEGSLQFKWLSDVDNSVAWYFFARIGQDNPSLIREYEELFRKIPAGRRALLLILMQSDDQQTRTFLESCLEDPSFESSWNDIQSALSLARGAVDPLSRPIHTGADLDLLWFEFLATGNSAAIVRLVDVLEWPDRIRAALESWLRTNASREPVTKKLWEGAGILCCVKTAEVLSAQDLDCHCTLERSIISQERFQKFGALLPFSFEGDLNYIWVKAAAKWSLASNAQQHPLVLSTVEAEAAKRKGRSRLSLLEIAAFAHIAHQDFGAAFTALGKSLTADPEEENRQLLKASADFEELEALSTENAVVSNDVGFVAREAAMACANTTEAARSFRSKLVLRDAGQQPSTAKTSWEFQYAKPGNLRVFQTAGTDYDEWITFDRAHFRGPAYSSMGRDLERNDRELNEMLLTIKWATFLRYARPTSVLTQTFDSAEYMIFEYKHLKPPAPSLVALVSRIRWAHWLLPRIWRPWSRHLNIISQAGSLQARLWADRRTGFLAKAILTFDLQSIGGVSRKAEVLQLFSSPNEPVSIVPPAFQILQR